MRKGTGEDATTTIRTRTEVEAEDSVWQLVTEVSKGGIIAARTCAIYQTTEGWEEAGISILWRKGNCGCWSGIHRICGGAKH